MLQYLASGRISHIFFVGDGSDFGVSSPAEWRSMLSRCFDLSPCTRSSPLEYRHYFYELTSWIRVMMWGFFVLSAHFSDSPDRGRVPGCQLTLRGVDIRISSERSRQQPPTTTNNNQQQPTTTNNNQQQPTTTNNNTAKH